MFEELVDGLLLSDGNLLKQSPGGLPNYQHGCKYSEYVLYIRNELVSKGISFTPKVYETTDTRGSGNVYYHVHSHVSTEFEDFYNRWYPNGKKIVPADIKLTPTVCLHWYLGDGWQYFNTKNGSCFGLGLGTYGFSNEDREILTASMADMGICTSVYKRGDIYIRKNSVESFLSYIGNSPVDCYKYKWRKVR